MKSCQPFFGLKPLIVGDVNTGKTAYTRLLLTQCRGGRTILVLDMAPETTRGIGGKMTVPAAPDIHYLTTQILPPRLTGKTLEDSLRIAAENAAHHFLPILAQYLVYNSIAYCNAAIWALLKTFFSQCDKGALCP